MIKDVRKALKYFNCYYVGTFFSYLIKIDHFVFKNHKIDEYPSSLHSEKCILIIFENE